MSVYSPGRPSTDRDMAQLLNGAPMFPTFSGWQQGTAIPGTAGLKYVYSPSQAPGTGVLTSGGTAVNNITTASSFATGLLPDGTWGLQGSMAGRVYLVQAVAAGFLMAAESPLVGQPSYWTVAVNTTIPPVAGTFPGVPLSAGDVRIVTMAPTAGWLQWISVTGTASLVCTELF